MDKKRIKDLTGQRFRRLIILRDTGKRKRGSVIWLCLCECGNLTEVRSDRLRSTETKSCGCLQRDIAAIYAIRLKNINYKHGDASRNKPARLYSIWLEMKARCYNPKHVGYRWYGHRGIKVCVEWINDYSIFKEWAINNGYRENLTIDRINNDENYEPSNCQFLTKSENMKKSWKKRKLQLSANVI